MHLLEYQAKDILRSYGLPTPQGIVVASSDAARAAAQNLDGPVMLKAQVLAGRRGKAGGIRTASTPAEAAAQFETLAGMTIYGLPVQQVLVEQQLSIEDEYYVSVMVDPRAECPILILSTAGGIDVETLTHGERSTLTHCPIDIAYGLMDYQVRGLVGKLAIPRVLHNSLVDVCRRLYAAFAGTKALLVEVNPLVVTKGGQLIAADARLNADDAAVPLVPPLTAIQQERLAVPTLANELERNGIQYVPMGGNIGIISTGAGATLAICDWIVECGGRPDGFLDLTYALAAGGFGKEAMVRSIAFALDTLSERQEIVAILINSIAGGLSVEYFAEAICEVIVRRGPPRQPFVVHVGGNGEDGAYTRLRGAGLPFETSLEQAVKRVVELATRAEQ